MWKVCPAWNRQRRQLVKAVGSDLSLRVIIEAMLNIEEKRQAIVAFCGEVMALKEDSERARRGGQHASGSGDVEVTSRFPCGGEFQLRLGLGGGSGGRGEGVRTPTALSLPSSRDRIWARFTGTISKVDDQDRSLLPRKY